MQLDRSSSQQLDVRRLIYGVLIAVACGVGFGKIASVDSVPDRVIQEFRLAQIPKTMEERAKALREKKLSDEDFEKELQRIYNALLLDAMKERPTLCANDRSRWATIRALVEPNARVYRYAPVLSQEAKDQRVKELNETNPNSYGYEHFRFYPHELMYNYAAECPEKYDQSRRITERYTRRLVPYAIDKVWETPGWDSIDVVKHGLNDEIFDPANPASGYLYSSKPPLLPTIMAAPYWVLYRCFGLSLVTQPFLTARILLVVYNLIPLALAFAALASILDGLGRSQWSKLFALAVAIFASFSLTYVATLNNHVPGFAAISLSLWGAMRILTQGRRNAWYFICAGFFGALAVACELPALAFAGLLCLALLIRAPGRTILFAIPAGLVVVVAFFATNYCAHQTLVPAYAHKRDHMQMAAEQALAENQASSSDAYAAGDPQESLFSPNDWYYYRYYPAGRPREAKYARMSHWSQRTGIDRGEPSIARYAFHSTVGSRGVFSLTPVWIFSLLGALSLLVCRPEEPGSRYAMRALGMITLALAVVFFAFFLTRDQGDRNYGGVSCCPRWFFPLAPLFVITMTPCLERLEKYRLGRWIAYLALFWSCASASFPTWSPWIHPWLYQYAVEWNLMTPY